MLMNSSPFHKKEKEHPECCSYNVISVCDNPESLVDFSVHTIYLAIKFSLKKLRILLTDCCLPGTLLLASHIILLTWLVGTLIILGGQG